MEAQHWVGYEAGPPEDKSGLLSRGAGWESRNGSDTIRGPTPPLSPQQGAREARLPAWPVTIAFIWESYELLA